MQRLSLGVTHDARPHGRISFGYGYDTYELDTYYLLEIDPWGRRFYHRGGMRTGDA